MALCDDQSTILHDFQVKKCRLLPTNVPHIAIAVCIVKCSVCGMTKIVSSKGDSYLMSGGYSNGFSIIRSRVLDWGSMGSETLQHRAIKMQNLRNRGRISKER